MPATKTLNKPANATGSAMKKKVDVKKWVWEEACLVFDIDYIKVCTKFNYFYQIDFISKFNQTFQLTWFYLIS